MADDIPSHTFKELFDDTIKEVGPGSTTRWSDSAVLLPDGTMSYHSEHWDFFDAISGGFKDMPEAQVETGAVRSGGIFRINEGQLGASFDIAKNQPLTREQLRFIKNAKRTNLVEKLENNTLYFL